MKTLLLQAAVREGQVYDITSGGAHNGNHGRYFPYSRTEATFKTITYSIIYYVL